MNNIKATFLILFILVFYNSCNIYSQQSYAIQTGAEQPELYFPLLKNKKVGLMGNQTSIVGHKHLVDFLLENDIDLKFAFAPEHGFRGEVERGEKFSNGKDLKTGLPLYSLYGKNSKADSLLNSIDVLIFDLQDVGARFYTYISSMHEIMELALKHNKKVIILDRPNPNGDQVDGPVRKDDKFKSFVSFHKIAMVHGLTVGELALMINGEGWLANGEKCDLTVIPVKNYDHTMQYKLPVIPSPSLPNEASVRLYASLCLFEATDISVGRGTDYPFQVVGYPDPNFGDFTFTPGVKSGMQIHVEQKGNVCYGIDLRSVDIKEEKFSLKYLLEFYKKFSSKDKFFTNSDFFDKLAGTNQLRKQVIAGWSEERIRKSWESDLNEYKKMRKRYLLYKDFE